jgi:hypothetical protein
MSGLLAQIGFGEETTYGTAFFVTRFAPLVDESITQDIERLESEGIFAGARLIRSQQWAPGLKRITGDVGLEWYQQNTALLWKHMLGSITSSFTAGVGTHTATLGSLFGKGLTMQIGRPTVTGTVIPFTYAGCKISSWTVAMEAGEIATLGLSMIAKSETTATALVTAAYSTDADKPFTYLHGGVSISGSSICVRSIEITGENNLSDERVCIGQDTIDEPLEMDRREITGTANLEFTSTQQYQRYLDGTELPIVLSLSASSSAQASVTMNCRYDGVTPVVEGRDLIVVEVPFKVVGTTAGGDNGGITAVIKNTQSSP